jgi:hypothetical protein
VAKEVAPPKGGYGGGGGYESGQSSQGRVMMMTPVYKGFTVEEVVFYDGRSLVTKWLARRRVMMMTPVYNLDEDSCFNVVCVACVGSRLGVCPQGCHVPLGDGIYNGSPGFSVNLRGNYLLIINYYKYATNLFAFICLQKSRKQGNDKEMGSFFFIKDALLLWVVNYIQPLHTQGAHSRL